jgi:hypothetical protein
MGHWRPLKGAVRRCPVDPRYLLAEARYGAYGGGSSEQENSIDIVNRQSIWRR